MTSYSEEDDFVLEEDDIVLEEDDIVLEDDFVLEEDDIVLEKDDFVLEEGFFQRVRCLPFIFCTILLIFPVITMNLCSALILLLLSAMKYLAHDNEEIQKDITRIRQMVCHMKPSLAEISHSVQPEDSEDEANGIDVNVKMNWRDEKDFCSKLKKVQRILAVMKSKVHKETKCPVSCSSGKNKKRHRKLQQQAQILKKRIATMQNQGMSAAVLQISPDNSNSSNQPSPTSQTVSSLHPPQKGLMKLTTGPPVDDLQAVQQEQFATAAAKENVPHMVAAVLQTCTDNSNSANQSSPRAEPYLSPHPPEPSIGMEPSTGPPVSGLQEGGVFKWLQDVQQEQTAAAKENVPHMVAAVLQTCTDNSNSANQSSPRAEPYLSPHPPEPSIGMEPSTGPPVSGLQEGGVFKWLQDVQQEQTAAAKENVPHMVAAVLQTCTDNSNSANQSSTRAEPYLSPHPPEPSIGMEPSTGPPVSGLQEGGVFKWLQDVQQEQTAAAKENVPHMVAAVLQTCTDNSNSANQSSPRAEPYLSPHPPEPSIGMEPSTGPPVSGLQEGGVFKWLQDVQQEQTAAAKENVPHMVAAVLQTCTDNSNSANQSSPRAEPYLSPHPPEPSIGMEPSTGPPVSGLQEGGVFKWLQDVQQEQTAAAKENVPHMVAAVLQTCTDNSNSANQSSPRAEPYLSPHPPEPSIGMEPSTGPPVSGLQEGGVFKWLQDVQQEQTAAAKENAQHIDADFLKTRSGNSNSSNQSSPDVQSHSSAHPPRSGTGMKPSTGPPFCDSQVVQQVQAPAAKEIAPHMVAALEGNPVVSSPIPDTGLMDATQQIQAEIQKPVPQMMFGVPDHITNLENIDCFKASEYAQNPQTHENHVTQLNPQMGIRQQTQLMGVPNNMPNSTGNSAMGPPQVMPDPGLSLGGMQRPTQAWLQLLQTLKSPPSAQQQQAILAVLKSNPQLMAAFIKQRTVQQQQQQMLLNESSMIAPPPQSVWYKQQQQQHLLAMQAMQRLQQQQPNQFPHPQPPMYPQHPRKPFPMNFGHQQGFQGDNSQFQFQQQPQQILMQPQIKQMASPTYPPVSPQQGILGHSQGSMPLPEQQLMQQVQSPSSRDAPFAQAVTAVQAAQAPFAQAVRSTQFTASPTTQNNTPQNQPIPSHFQQKMQTQIKKKESTDWNPLYAERLKQHVKSLLSKAAQPAQAVHSTQFTASPKTQDNNPQNQHVPSPRQQLGPSPHYPAQFQSPHPSLSVGTTRPDQLTSNNDRSPHASLLVGTKGLTGPDEMASKDDMMFTDLSNPDLSVRTAGLTGPDQITSNNNRSPHASLSEGTKGLTGPEQMTRKIVRPTHLDLSMGTTGLTGPDQMASKDDMMFTNHSNPESLHQSLLSQLQSRIDRLPIASLSEGTKELTGPDQMTRKIVRPTHLDPFVGTIGLTGPGQMASKDDMMFTNLSNPESSHQSLFSQLQSPVNQELGLSSRDDDVDRAHLTQVEQLDKYFENLYF